MSRYINFTIKFLVPDSEPIICEIKENYIPLRYRGKQGSLKIDNIFKKEMDIYEFYYIDGLQNYDYDYEIIGAEIVDETLQNNSMNAETMTQTFTEIMKMPLDVRKIIFQYIPPEVYTNNVAKLIKNIIQVYEVDHDSELTKRAKMYYIKNILSFSQYVFKTLYEDEDEYDGCNYGKKSYDKLELSPYMKLVIKDK